MEFESIFEFYGKFSFLSIKLVHIKTIESKKDIFFATIGYDRVAKLLILNNAELNIPDEFHFTPLICAAFNSNLKLQIFTEKMKTERNYRLIPYLDHESIARMLVHKGAALNRKDKYGGTALYWASYKGDLYHFKIF